MSCLGSSGRAGENGYASGAFIDGGFARGGARVKMKVSLNIRQEVQDQE